MSDYIDHLNPDGLHKNPAFSQMVSVKGLPQTIYIGGQNAVNAKGEIIAKGDLAGQALQILKNLEIALQAIGANPANLVKWNIYVVEGQDPRRAIEVFGKHWGRRYLPPAITVLFVSGLANPDFLMEIDAIAVV